ncbi:MAG: asparaginase [Alphaproteobacteria bacterium]
MKPRVVLIGTGGTIASRYDEKLGRAVPSESAEDLVAMLPQLRDMAELELDNFASVPSFDMSPGFALELAGRVNDTLARDDVSGVVVTQGTDTLEETCYLADLLLGGEKPAVFTGAQRMPDDPVPDGPGNIMDSVAVAASPEARGLGAVVCFNGRVHAARDVTKVHASALETFQSYDHGALGEVDGGRVVIHRRPVLRRAFAVDRLEERVDLIRLSMGSDARLVDAAVAGGAAGLVIEAFGRGNGPTGLTEPLRRAVARGIPVVVTSRCPAGRVKPIYGGGGGGRDLEDAGVVFAGDLKGPKARVLLMVLLADPATRDRVAEIVHELAP